MSRLGSRQPISDIGLGTPEVKSNLSQASVLGSLPSTLPSASMPGTLPSSLTGLPTQIPSAAPLSLPSMSSLPTISHPTGYQIPDLPGYTLVPVSIQPLSTAASASGLAGPSALALPLQYSSDPAVIAAVPSRRDKFTRDGRSRSKKSGRSRGRRKAKIVERRPQWTGYTDHRKARHMSDDSRSGDPMMHRRSFHTHAPPPKELAPKRLSSAFFSSIDGLKDYEMAEIEMYMPYSRRESLRKSMRPALCSDEDMAALNAIKRGLREALISPLYHLHIRVVVKLLRRFVMSGKKVALFNPSNSFQRMLVHELAEIIGLKHEVTALEVSPAMRRGGIRSRSHGKRIVRVELEEGTEMQVCRDMDNSEVFQGFSPLRLRQLRNFHEWYLLQISRGLAREDEQDSCVAFGRYLFKLWRSELEYAKQKDVIRVESQISQRREISDEALDEIFMEQLERSYPVKYVEEDPPSKPPTFHSSRAQPIFVNIPVHSDALAKEAYTRRTVTILPRDEDVKRDEPESETEMVKNVSQGTLTEDLMVQRLAKYKERKDHYFGKEYARAPFEVTSDVAVDQVFERQRSDTTGEGSRPAVMASVLSDWSDKATVHEHRIDDSSIVSPRPTGSDTVVVRDSISKKETSWVRRPTDSGKLTLSQWTQTNPHSDPSVIVKNSRIQLN